ncbi:ROK family transcriptional regulator [Gandjariella thermophila]|uniref:ROK family transcriptional regulator n=1 Tax=Gandjariella thermophila TaxID=1931992 RepID=UPI001CEF5FD0|nr:ROK family transcriptional regulator [Gandjariella thermophila]
MNQPRPAGQHTVRRHNSALVLGAVVESPGMSRAGVAARTGLAKATVSSLVDRLVAAGLLAETGPQARSGRGRRGTGLSLSPSGPHGLGVEIGVDYLATCLVDLTGEVHALRIRPGDNRAASVARVLARVTRAVRTAFADAQRRGVPVGGVGVAVPGLVEAATGLLRVAPNLGWRDVDVRAEVRRRLGLGDLPVLVGNEADFAALAELWCGGHPDLRDFLHVSGEIGIGAGLVVDGTLFRGVRGFGGEIGHVCVDPVGPECACGARGCLERLAGQEWILRAAGVWDGVGPLRPPAALLDELVDRLTAEDGRALRAVRGAGRSLGIGVSAVLNAVDVPTVVLGGSYARLERWLRPSLQNELDRRVVSAAWSRVEVLGATLGTEAAVRGAAGAVLHEIIIDPDPYVSTVLPG